MNSKYYVKFASFAPVMVNLDFTFSIQAQFSSLSKVVQSLNCF